MQIDELKQRIARVEEFADQAKQACQKGTVTSDLRQSIDDLHQKARAAKHAGEGQESATEDSLRKDVMQIEESADRAMQACRNAGSSVDAQTQQAVLRVHAEASSLKKDMMQAA